MPAALHLSLMTGNFAGDLRFAFRAFSRSPRFTIPALVALALGIGATSAIFSVVRGVMLKPLPYRDPARIVSIFETSPSQTRGIVASANFVEWRERNRSFEYLGMVGPGRLTIQLNGQPLEVTGRTGVRRRLLGARRLCGARAHVHERRGSAGQRRRHSPEPRVLAVAHSEAGATSWVPRFDADGVKRTVVGIMPPQFTIEGVRADFYITYGWTTEGLRGAIGRGLSHAIARVRDGVTLKQAADEMATIAARAREGSAAPEYRTLGDPHPDSRPDYRNDQAGAHRALGRGRARPSHRLRQRGEPPARAQHGPSARVRAANGARRRSRPAAAADADREPDAVAGRRCCWVSHLPSSFIAVCWLSSRTAFPCRGSIRSRSTFLWWRSRLPSPWRRDCCLD